MESTYDQVHRAMDRGDWCSAADLYRNLPCITRARAFAPSNRGSVFKSRRTPPERTQAYVEACNHESGHGTLAALFNVGITRAYANADGTGAVEYDPDSYHQASTWHKALILAGGALGEYLFLDDYAREGCDLLAFCGPPASQRRGSVKSDFEQFAELLPALNREVAYLRNHRDPFAAFPFVFGAGYDILEQSRRSATKVRNAVIEAGELTGAEVRAAAGLGSSGWN